ncbi:MAG: FAD-binding oxidoreductase, partial [Clostridia bacterium]|nr:FAD-binding oxidoreductase [Clostridia bacterium]
MQSVWEKERKRPTFAAAEGEFDTDVLIVGGGMVGLLCAKKLKEVGVDCMVVEADGICSGITKNTTAKITLHHGLIYYDLIRRFGVDRARQYWQANKAAMQEFERLCKGIACDYEHKDSYVYELQDRRRLEKEISALDKIGQPADFVRHLPLPFTVAGAVKIKNQAQFHPLKFAYALAENLPIYEHTRVREITPDYVLTDRGRIRANKVIVATHFPFINIHGWYIMKLYQHRSYVLALSGADLPDGMYVDASQKGLSFRTYGDWLLLGGGSHRTGKVGGGWQALELVANRHYPDAHIAARWATQDCMSLDGVPYIGQYSPRLPQVYVATGFNKWGMTGAGVAALILSDLVQGRETPFAEVFAPSRSVWRPQMAVNV